MIILPWKLEGTCCTKISKDSKKYLDDNLFLEKSHLHNLFLTTILSSWFFPSFRRILCIDSFGPGCDSMVQCDGVIQAHVIEGSLYLNLFVRIEVVYIMGIPLSGNLNLTNRELEEAWHDHERLESLQWFKKLKFYALSNHFCCYILSCWRVPFIYLETWTRLCVLPEVYKERGKVSKEIVVLRRWKSIQGK